MKILALADGTKLEVSDLSTERDIVNVFRTRNEVGTFWSNLTDKSLDGAKLDGISFSAIPESMNAVLDAETGNVTAHFLNKVEAAENAVDAAADPVSDEVAENTPEEEQTEETELISEE